MVRVPGLYPVSLGFESLGVYQLWRCSMRDKGYRRHQYFKHKEEQRKLLERYEPRSLNVRYRVAGSYLRGESGRAAFIDEQAAKRSRTPKPCSCYLCSVSTKRDGYSIADKRRLAHGLSDEE